MPNILLKAAFATATAARVAFVSAKAAFIGATTFGAYAIGRACSQYLAEPVLNANLDVPGVGLAGFAVVVVAPCVAGYYGMKGGLHGARKIDEAVNRSLAAILPAPKTP